jgi:hypothetical protein
MNADIDELMRTQEANDNGVETLLGWDDIYRPPPPYDWACLMEHDEHRNPDWLPEWLVRRQGCPKCGGAFVEIDALKLGTTVINTISPEKGIVYGGQRILGARYVCCDGHATLHQPPDPALLAVMGGGGLIGVLAMSRLFHRRGAAR